MIICFHGTSKSAVSSILREGFIAGTYFARHLEDALEFGGPYVFAVRFDEDRFNIVDSEDWWQFHLAEVVPPEKIWKLVKYHPESLFENPKVVE